jgi:hypothetical protein
MTLRSMARLAGGTDAGGVKLAPGSHNNTLYRIGTHHWAAAAARATAW